MRKIYCTTCKIYKEFKKLKNHIFVIKHNFVLEFVIMEEESIEILKILGLISNM